MSSKQQQFLETIKLVDGKFMHSEFHLQRMRQTMKDIFHLPVADTFIQNLIVPQEMRQGVVKCRLLYDSSIFEADFQHYTSRKISFLKLVDGQGIDYSRKYADRSSLTKLLQDKSSCDDVLIVKNGRITDTSYSNVVLSDGSGYYTPISYLLNGTCRQRLLVEGKIIQVDLSVGDLSSFEKIYLINAMLDLEDGVNIPVSNLVF